jgi:D-glycerate 3-kinase
MAQSSTVLCQVLAQLIPPIAPDASEADLVRQLEQATLADETCAAAFGVTPDTVSGVVRDRLPLFRAVHHPFTPFCQHRLGWSIEEVQNRLDTLWLLWLPLAMQLLKERTALRRPLIQGILGGQGTGKTTLAAILTLILNQLGLRVCELSIDDLYKTYAERQALQTQDSRMKWRGPPGTHDIELGLSVLQRLRHAEADTTIAIPRFDKSLHNGAGDRAEAMMISGADIILFEGWFVGNRPVDPQVFDQAPPPIVTEGDRQFARDINRALADYLPLWALLDRLIVLSPTDYRLSQQWRREAEQRMRATGRSGMSDAEIDEFVLYFWRSLHPELFITPMCQQCDYVNLVIEIQPDHSPGRVYCPQPSPGPSTAP